MSKLRSPRLTLLSLSLVVPLVSLGRPCAVLSADFVWLNTATGDVRTASNWDLNLVPGVQAGSNADNIHFGAVGSDSPTQANENFWIRKLFFDAGAQSHTYTGNSGTSTYLSLNVLGFAGEGTSALFNNSSTQQLINVTTGKLGIAGLINTGTAAGGSLVINGALSISDGSNGGTLYTGLTGSNDVYFNVDSSINPAGIVTGGAWTGGSTTSGMYRRARQRFFMTNFAGRAYLGDIGTNYAGTFHLDSTANGALRLTHNNALGSAAASGNGLAAVMIYGGTTGNGTLELSGGISVTRGQMYLDGRSGLVADDPHILNVSGDNTLTLQADWGTGTRAEFGTTADDSSTTSHAGNWNIQSDSGTLTIAAGTTSIYLGAIYNTETVSTTLQLLGAGNGQIDAPIQKYLTNPTLSILKNGTGTWTLTHANTAVGVGSTYDGNVTIQQGTLALSGSGSLANSPSIEVLSSGVWDVSGVGGYMLNPTNVLLKGTGTINGNLTAGTSNVIAPGSGGVGTLSFGNDLNLTGGSTLPFELTNNPLGTNDKLAIAGGLNLSGVTDVNIAPINGNLGSGTYTLMTYAGALSGDLTNLNLTGTSASSRQTAQLSTATANQINLVVTGTVANLTWVGGNNSDAWDVGGTVNWTGHPTDNHFYDGDKVTFSSSGTSTADVVGVVAPGQVDFTNGVGNDKAITGGSIQVAGSMNFSGAGNVTLSNSDTTVNGSLSTSGAGNVTISTGSLTVNSTLTLGGTGTVTFANSFSTNTLPATMNLNSGNLAFDRTDDLSLTNQLAGAGTFRKQNTNTVTLTGNSSSFSGAFVVESGTLRTSGVGTLGSSSGGTTVMNGATLDVGDNGNTTVFDGSEAVSIVGTGVGDIGALTSTQGNSETHINQLTLTGDAKISARGSVAGRSYMWIDGPGAAIHGNGYNLEVEVITANGIPKSDNTEMNWFVGDTNLNNITLSGGNALYLGGATTLGLNTGTLTFKDHAVLGFYGNDGAEPNASTGLIDKPMVIDNTTNGGGLAIYRGNKSLSSPITMNGNLDVAVYNSTNDTNWKATLTGPLSGPAGLSVHLSASSTTSRIGTVVLTGNNNYAGTTTIGGGGGLASGVTAANDRITLQVNGTHTGGGDYTVAEKATLGGTGSIGSSILVNTGGTLAPGANVGTLTIAAATLSADAILRIEYDNSLAPKVDQLIVSGALDITNAIVDFDNLGVGNLTGASHVFATYAAGLLTGTFSPTGILDLPTGYAIDYNYLGANQIALVSTGPVGLPGDFNDDGFVDSADYVIWRKNEGTSNPLPNDNGIGGVVGTAHYDLWRGNFGNPPGVGSGMGTSAAVPEPTAMALLALTLSAFVCQRRRFIAMGIT
ncbi:MAG: autotransporter-associated beta strand repeat-containing protein [Pirellulales bacterium]|nr:autotransporter-associated beta strand repeat-containing protein [Pirellulales bacterium]